MYERTKVQEQLSKVQTGCKARLLTIEQIENMIAECEKWIVDNKLPDEVLPYIHFEYLESVAKAYSYPAESTRLDLSFTKQGKVKDITLSRTYAPKGYHTSRFHLSHMLFENEYELDWNTPNEKQKRLLNRFVRSLGFNAGSLTAQV